MKSRSMYLTKLLALSCGIALMGGLYAQTEDSDVFRKNISKTATLSSNKAKMNIMPVYVPFVDAQGIPVKPDIKNKYVPDTGKPIVVSYVDVMPGTGGASDVWVAISRDDGATWKRKNVSRTAEDSSFGTYKGDSRKPVLQVQGNYILVAWSDKFCTGGSPRYSLEDGDTYGVGGSQGSIDYDQENDTEGMGIGVVPFSCVWVARGLVVTETEANDLGGPFYGYEIGEIVWYKAERVTSARRDAYQLFMGGKVKAGFAISWQEDPEGLRPGEADGPGTGWSGATTNHKTDIWYSYLKWGDFLEVEEFEPVFEPLDDDVTKPRAANRMSLPVRISDNQSCKREHVEAIDDKGNEHAYCAKVCANYVNVTSSGGKNSDICVTSDGRLLDGDTGASRPNLFLQSKSGGAWAILAYEETKGAGTGNSDSHDGDHDGLETVEEIDPEDLGKDVIYHSFDFTKPQTVHGGNILNLPQLDENYEPIWIEGEDLPMLTLNGDATGEIINTGRWATENARRVRFILQSSKAALAKNDYCRVTGEGVPLLAIYKQGMEGKGRPSDIMLRRIDIYENGVVASGNPYDFKKFQCDELVTDANGKKSCLAGALNMSSVTPLEVTPKALEVGDDDDKVVYDKLEKWQWRRDNLGDQSWDTSMVDARAHRGQIRGDFVVLGFTWTPNWAASRNGNAKYDFYVRRSFDGGKTWNASDDIWPDDVTSVFDITEPRNVSLLPNNKQNVVEPRIVAAPGTIWKKAPKTVPGTCMMAGGEYYDEVDDKQSTNSFVISYGLEVNWKKGVDYDKDSNKPDPQPTDMNFSRSFNKGTTYDVVWNSNAREHRWDWLANRQDVAEGEAQLRISPSGNKMYATYLSESGKSIPADDHFYGSDIWLRKVVKTPVDINVPSPEPIPVPVPIPIPVPIPGAESSEVSCVPDSLTCPDSEPIVIAVEGK